MPEYLMNWQFWFAVVVVALIVNWAYARFFGGQGKLV